jgi:GxxExxY protein
LNDRATNVKVTKENAMENCPTAWSEEEIGESILDCAFKVHTVLGAGLLVSVYEAALAIELHNRGLKVERQKPIPVCYEGHELPVGFRADLIVEDKVLVELRSVEAILPKFKRTTTNYVRLIPVKLGFLINFNEEHLKDGIVRVTNDADGKPFFQRSGSSVEVDLLFPSSPSRSSRGTQS